MSFVCTNTSREGIGTLCYDRDPITQAKIMIFTTPGFEFSSATDFADEDKWKENIRDGYLFPSPYIVQVEDSSYEDQATEYPNGTKVATIDGKRGYIVHFDGAQDNIKKMMKWGLTSVYLADINGNIIGLKYSGESTIKPIPYDYVRHLVKLPNTIDASVERVEFREMTNVYAENLHYDTPSTFNVLQTLKEGVQTVTLTVGTQTANVFTVQVNRVDGTKYVDGVAATAAKTGLTVDNFQIVDDSETVLTATTDYTVTESATTDGLYTIDGTDALPAVVTTIQAVASTDNLVKSLTARSIPT